MADQTTEHTVTGCEYADRTVYTGTRQALVAAGLARQGPFPGDVPDRKAIRDEDSQGRRRVLTRAAGGMFRVTLYLTRAERLRRRRREQVNERLAQVSQQLADLAESAPQFRDRAARWVELAFSVFVHTFMAQDARGRSTGDPAGPYFDKTLHADLDRMQRQFVQAVHHTTVHRDTDGVQMLQRERAALADADFQQMLETLISREQR